MSAKDDFKKRVQQGSVNRENLENKVKSDIQFFRARLYELVKEIEGWLHNTGVKTDVIDAPYTDESIDSLPEVKHLSNYKASFVTINNGMKSASLVPLGVYGGDVSGWCRLLVQKSSDVEKFLLKLKKDDHTWTIKREVDLTTISYLAAHRPMTPPEQELTEDTFFQAIADIAD